MMLKLQESLDDRNGKLRREHVPFVFARRYVLFARPVKPTQAPCRVLKLRCPHPGRVWRDCPEPL